jgi:hypothetical protein
MTAITNLMPVSNTGNVQFLKEGQKGERISRGRSLGYHHHYFFHRDAITTAGPRAGARTYLTTPPKPGNNIQPASVGKMTSSKPASGASQTS